MCVTPKTAEHALKALARFKKDYEARWRKAVQKVTKDADALLAFFNFPADPWVQLKTTNPVESAFAAVCLRTKASKGQPASPTDGLPTN
jgi:putative transposase